MTAHRRAAVVRACLAVLTTTVVAVVPTAAVAAHPAVEIRYTEYGVPHIRATTFTGLGEGYGYASAESNLCTLADVYMTVAGERSRYLGADAPANPDLGRASNSLNSDLYFARWRQTGLVQRLLARPAPQGPSTEVRQLVRGYASGFNEYLRRVGVDGITDPTCRSAPWVRPISELDVYRHLLAVDTMTGTAAVIDGIVGAHPPADGTAPPPPSAGALAEGFRRTADPAALGSNAIAAGSQGVAAGAGVLLGNPHFPWQGSRRFWQSHLTIPGRLDVAGASLLGLPAVMIGHNADVAWSHTVSKAVTFGLFEVPTVAGDPTRYEVDGVPEAMTEDHVSVLVRRPDATLRTVHRTLWSTRYGPVLTAAPGVSLPWAGTVYAVRDANATNLRSLNTWLEIGAARDSRGVLDTLARTQGLPWINTVAVDRRGEALFADVQSVPFVTDAHVASCGTQLGQAVFPLSGVPILDGSRAACDWGSDPGAVEPGLLGPDRLPRLIRRDYVANANDSAWLANPAEPITGPLRVVGTSGTPVSARTQELLITAEKRLAGTDGLPGRGFSGAAMRQILFTDHSRLAELTAADTAAMCDEFPGHVAPSDSGPVAVGAGCAALHGWDGTYRLGSRGALLFARFAERLAALSSAAWRVPFDPSDPLHTPRELNTDADAVRLAFGNAAAELTAAGVPLDGRLGDYQSVTRAGERIPVHGGPHAAGVLDVIETEWDPAAGVVDVGTGSSFIQVVEFPDRGGPRAWTLLTYAQSGDPTSAHYADQTHLFSRGRWVPERFTESQIRSFPALRTTRLP
ncbi:penicillin acylase family protein [Mangrovihabitans endophyticus]|uniref:Penicillin amidase n=1 Tax=Mangrovihabitans endophyticus TaxID=1751298 RepID=A0A8J3FLK6_9ACTN|nr:penicillin acylase family protein [Mangrovihabitans endophyticus]GGK73167.1 penicillin amidase [Mangrovihabitans endophyticus]